MEKILDKKITMSLWKLIAFTTFAIAFITLGIATGNVVVSENFITVIKLITIIVAGSIVIVAVVKILLDKADRIRIFINENINNIILTLIIVLVASLVFGIVRQINIGAMSEKELKKIAIVGILVVTILLIASITNIIKLTISQKRNKRRNRMRKLVSLIARQNINFNTDSLNTIQIKALVTDLYSLSVQDVKANIEDNNIKKLYRSEVFMTLLNESVRVSKELGIFQNSFDTLVANKYISTMEAATAKVVTFDVDREVLLLL